MDYIIAIYSAISLFFLIASEKRDFALIKDGKFDFDIYRQITDTAYDWVSFIAFFIYIAILIFYLFSQSELSKIILFGAQGSMIVNVIINTMVRFLWKRKNLAIWFAWFGTLPAAILIMFVMLSHWGASVLFKVQIFIGGSIAEILTMMIILALSQVTKQKSVHKTTAWEKFD